MEEIHYTDKENMSTMVSILEAINKTGYIQQFKVTPEGLTSVESGKSYQPDEIEINHFYRFEVESNPDDSSIIYAIETNDGERGTLIDSYGTYSDPLIASFIKKVESIKK